MTQRVLDTPDCPRENLETFFGDRLPTQLAHTVLTLGHAVSSPPYVLQHREQVLLSRHRSEAFDGHRGSLADTLAEGDRAGLCDRRSEFCKLRLKPLLPLGQQAVNVETHTVSVRRTSAFCCTVVRGPTPASALASQEHCGLALAGPSGDITDLADTIGPDRYDSAR